MEPLPLRSVFLSPLVYRMSRTLDSLSVGHGSALGPAAIFHHPEPKFIVERSFNSFRHLQTRHADEYHWAHNAQKRVHRLYLALRPGSLRDLPH